MTRQNIIEAGIAENNLLLVKDAVYEATDAAINAIEQAYEVKLSKAPATEKDIYEVAYVSKAAAKASIYEIASKALSSMSVGAADEKAIIAATAIAMIRQVQWS